MRRDLSLPIAPAPLPSEVRIVPFSIEAAAASRELMQRVYTDGLKDGGISFDGWWRWLTADREYDPELMFVATVNDAVVGFCACWRDAFVKDLVVDASFRRRGLGTALLTMALEAFASRGAAFVDLKTDVGNLRAQSVYRRLGFEVTEYIG